MLSSLLLKYFKNLSKKDRNDLSKFVRSPFHNQREEVVRLFDYLNEHIGNPSVPKRTTKGVEHATEVFKKEKAFESIYQGKKSFNDALMRATMSQLTDVIKEFFVHSELKNNKKFQGEKSFIFRQSLLLRGYKDEYEQYLMSDFNSSFGGETHDSYHRFVILHERSFWQAKHKRSENLFFDEMGAALDAGYVVELLRLACSMQSHKTVVKVEYHLALLETVLKRIETGWFKGHLYIEAFYHAYWTMNYKAEHYQQLDTILTDFSDSFSHADLYFLYKIVLNYNAWLSNLGDRNAIVVLWKYFKTGFDKKILILNNIISPHDCLTVVALGLSHYVNDVPWVDAFIKEYLTYLPLKERDSYSHMIDGIYHFYLKNYEKSMHAFKKVTFEDEHHQLQSRRMFAVMYFEQKEFDALVSHLDSFKVYLHRQKTMAYHKEGHLNFIRFMEKLMKINLDNEKDCLLLWAYIKQHNYIAMKDWFEEKLLKKS